MTGAFLLMLPVAWVYILTRRKKGYRQSVVQTLIILPIVVAGVVLLVKNSVALAFSLGGIVAAVSFRNTLRDTKDAVCIFLATAVGLAAGVQVMSAAAVMSVLFNVVILIFWYTDFGRAPANLEGPGATRRLARSRAMANRSGAFVSMLDREILRSMTPEQLGAIAARAKKRADRPDSAVKAKKPLGTRVRVRTGNPKIAQPAVEALLASQVKEWTFAGSTRESGGGAMLEFRVRLRKSFPPTLWRRRFVRVSARRRRASRPTRSNLRDRPTHRVSASAPRSLHDRARARTRRDGAGTPGTRPEVRKAVAIKILDPDIATAVGAERFLREIRITAQLQHPNIVPLLDSGEAVGLLYSVMPYIEGESLRDRLMCCGRPPVAESVSIACEVADALEYAHSRGVVHRDIKPENILLSNGHAVIADFGIARAMELAGGATLTGVGLPIGTVAYMSPEQATSAAGRRAHRHL